MYVNTLYILYTGARMVYVYDDYAGGQSQKVTQVKGPALVRVLPHRTAIITGWLGTFEDSCLLRDRDGRARRRKALRRFDPRRWCSHSCRWGLLNRGLIAYEQSCTCQAQRAQRLHQRHLQRSTRRWILSSSDGIGGQNGSSVEHFQSRGVGAVCLQAVTYVLRALRAMPQRVLCGCTW